MAAKRPLASLFEDDEQKGHESMGAETSTSSVASANSPTAIPQGDIRRARGPDESSGRHGSGVAFEPTMSAPPTQRGQSTMRSKTSPERSHEETVSPTAPHAIESTYVQAYP